MKLDRLSIFNFINNVIVEELVLRGVDIEIDSRFTEDLSLDKPDINTLAYRVECKYDVYIPQINLDRMETIVDLIDFVELCFT